MLGLGLTCLVALPLACYSPRRFEWCRPLGLMCIQRPQALPIIYFHFRLICLKISATLSFTPHPWQRLQATAAPPFRFGLTHSSIYSTCSRKVAFQFLPGPHPSFCRSFSALLDNFSRPTIFYPYGHLTSIESLYENVSSRLIDGIVL